MEKRVAFILYDYAREETATVTMPAGPELSQKQVEIAIDEYLKQLSEDHEGNQHTHVSEVYLCMIIPYEGELRTISPSTILSMNNRTPAFYEATMRLDLPWIVK